MKRILSVLLVLCFCMTLVSGGTVVAATEKDCYTVYISGTEDYNKIHNVLLLLNQLRADHNLSPLVLDAELTAIAMQGAAEAAVYQADERPNTGRLLVDNTAVGYASVQDLMFQLALSPGALADMLNSQYKTIGLGCFQRADGVWAWTQLYSTHAPTAVYAPTGTVYRESVPIHIWKENMEVDVSVTSPHTMIVGDTFSPTVTMNTPHTTEGPIDLVGGYQLLSSDRCLQINNETGTITATHAGTATVTICFDNGAKTLQTTTFDVVVREAVGISCQWESDSVFTVSWTNAQTEDVLFITDAYGDEKVRVSAGDNSQYTFSSAECGNIYRCALVDEQYDLTLGTFDMAHPSAQHTYDDDHDTGCDVCKYERVVTDLTYQTTLENGRTKIVITGGTNPQATDLYIPDTIDGYSVVEIESNAFKNYTSLKDIHLPSTLKYIYSYAFSGCTSLRKIEIPSRVIALYDGAFSGCSNLVDITLPDSLKYIESYVFKECIALQEIAIPDHVIVVRDGAFQKCTALKEMILPNKLSLLGESAFSGCTSLTKVVIPPYIEALEDYTFVGCTSLTDVSLPNGIKGFRAAAFMGCTSLREISIPDSVTWYSEDLFSGCASLTTVKLSTNADALSWKMFNNCTSLSEIYIPIIVNDIDFGAFRNCFALGVVYYEGTYEQATAISILTGNQYLTGARWVFESHIHRYDNDHDQDCNVCGFLRDVTTIPGDADGNGKVNNRDLGLLQRYINGQDDIAIDLVAIDMDKNGRINNRDLGLLQQQINN